MINWKRCSFAQIKEKWTKFKSKRIKTHDTLKSSDKVHITCLEREALIEDLLHRNECANRVIESYRRLKDCIEDQ